MDRLLRGPEGSRRGGALTSDGAGKINPRGLRQLSKAYRLWRLMNILWANLKQEIKLRLLGSPVKVEDPGTTPRRRVISRGGVFARRRKLDVYEPLLYRTAW